MTDRNTSSNGIGFFARLDHIPLWVLLAVAAVLYIPFAFLGYGSDSDSYSVVRIGQYFVETLDYLPSRLPGYFVHEVFVYFLNLVGGSLLSNLGTISMTLIMLFSFNRICRLMNVRQANLLTVILMIHPFVWVNATSTIDYLWALGFAFFGFERLMNKKYTTATILLALAIGSRLSTVMIIGLFLFFLWTQFKTERRAIFLTGLAAIIVGFVFYIPPLDFLEWDISRWLVLSTGDPVLWTPALRIGRFLYKNLMFWGVLAVLWLVFLFAISLWRRFLPKIKSWDGLTWLCLIVILCSEILFLRVPIEMEYLLPLLPFVLILLGKLFSQQPVYLLVLLILVFSANFVWLNPAHSLTPNQTSGVAYGLWIEKGYFLQDIANRLANLTL